MSSINCNYVERCIRESILQNWTDHISNDISETLCRVFLDITDPAVRNFIPYTDESSVRKVQELYQSIRFAAEEEESHIQNLPLSSLVQAVKDKNLIKLFNHLAKTLPEESLPLLDSDLTKRAEEIRNWMSQNEDGLSKQFTSLNLVGLGLTYLPSEINFFRNLHSLILSNNPMVGVSPDLDLPELEMFILEGTQIKYLNSGLKFPKLVALYLTNTPLKEFPRGLEAPRLQGLFLQKTKFTSFPEETSFPNLNALYLENSEITTPIPEGMISQLFTFKIDNTPLAAVLQQMGIPIEMT